MSFISLFTAWSCFALLVRAGFPAAPEGLTTKQITNRPGASISYKRTTICETRAAGYAGYVHIPSKYLADTGNGEAYNISMFFWYFEARKSPRTAQTAIYLAGGPGISSMYGVTLSGGPCTVLPDSNSTESSPWAWNEYVNMLYVDQPVGTGFSYDALINGTRDLLYVPGGGGGADVTPLDAYNGPPPDEDLNTRYGTFSSLDATHTANSSANVARTLWQFAQVWFADFPGYQTFDERVSFWGNSYGGFFVPFSAAYFQEQNVKIEAGVLAAVILPVGSVGWTNGCVDMLYQAEWYPEMANKNTYDMKSWPEDVYAAAKEAWGTENGCRDLILECREAGEAYDPEGYGNDDTVNKLCFAAEVYCATNLVLSPWSVSTNRSAMDFAHLSPDPSPPSYLVGFFNQPWVQKELGVPLNFSSTSYLVNSNMLYTTADPFRAAGLKKIEYLLDQGIKVNMIYGDRDYRCPWIGAEKLSVAANWTAANAFRSAGYADIKIGDCGNNGGAVRQHGNLSFSRVYQAGHDVAYAQPRTAFEIFTRSMLDYDIATGRSSVDDSYATKGPNNTFHIRNVLPLPPPAFRCDLYAVAATCTVEQYAALVDGTAVIENTAVIWPVGVTPGSLVGLS